MGKQENLRRAQRALWKHEDTTCMNCKLPLAWNVTAGCYEVPKVGSPGRYSTRVCDALKENGYPFLTHQPANGRRGYHLEGYSGPSRG